MQERLGRYRVEGLIAEGGMASVFRARDLQLGREIALKVLASEFSRDPVRVERFRLEARRIAALQHPNIVPLLDYGEEGGRLFLVMPFYGNTVRDLLMRQGALPLAQALSITGQMADALDYAHEQGLIHRDVKPENILLDSAGNALLTDFGIAKSAPSAPASMATSAPLRMAEAGQRPMASVEYSSPEHLLGRPMDERTDVYGLAVVVYEMLTNHVPFTLVNDELYKLLMQMLTERPPAASSVAPQPLPAGVDGVIGRALDRDPAQRFATASAFYQALAQAMALPVPSPHSGPVRPLVPQAAPVSQPLFPQAAPQSRPLFPQAAPMSQPLFPQVSASPLSATWGAPAVRPLEAGEGQQRPTQHWSAYASERAERRGCGFAFLRRRKPPR